MAFRNFGSVILAALALGALFASASQAQQWDVGGAKLASGAPVEAAAKATSTTVLTSKLLGSPFKLTAIALQSRNGTIVQTGTGKTGVSTLTGFLIFTGITVDEPVGCQTSSPIETVALTGTAQMGNTAATSNNVYVKIVPTSGEVFTTLKITECAAAGSYPVKGSIYVKASNPTGTAAVTQGGSTSGAINSSQEGGLTLGKEPAALEGIIDISLAGPSLGKTFALTAE